MASSDLEKEEYKRRLNTFRVTCRVYKREKTEMTHLEQKYPEILEMDFCDGAFKIGLDSEIERGDLELYQFLKENVSLVEEMFYKIEKKCGKDAKEILWTLFVEALTQESTASVYNMTRRQLQYSINKWMTQVFDDE